MERDVSEYEYYLNVHDTGITISPSFLYSLSVQTFNMSFLKGSRLNSTAEHG